MGFPSSQPAQVRSAYSQLAEGILSEAGDPGAYGTGTALVSGTVYGWLGGLLANDPVVGVMLRNSTAAGGSTPTTLRSGIADATGKILAVSANLNAAANMPAGPCLLPFATAANPFLAPASGGYYACVIVNGVWGTPPTPIRQAGAVGTSQTAYGTFAPPRFGWTGQTDLPAVGSSLTITNGAALAYYMAFYRA